MARKPSPARTDAPPTPNSRPSWRPAVPPPPVSGAAVGNCVTVAVVVTVARGVDAARLERVGVAVGEDAAGELGARVAEAETETEAETEALAVVTRPEAAALAAVLPAARLLVAGCVVVDPPPAGDGVRAPECVAEPDDVSGVGTKVDGTEEPVPMQAETVTVSRTAPAARRPAASQAPRVAAGVLSRIFMDPPRTRVRYTR
jgi:hypothetical protein